MPAAWSRDIRAVLFDLDGTLADTAPDLAFALETLLLEEGRPRIPYAQVRAVASHGARSLLALGFGLTPEDPAYPPLRARLLALYERHCTHASILFPGVPALIDALQTAGLAWGIVTNKAARFSGPVVRHLGLAPPGDCVISGDTTPHSKPHPEPLLLACRRLGHAPHECLYVGDSERDVIAGRRAGMRTLVALFGYLQDRDDPAQWGADGHINSVLEVLDWLGLSAPGQASSSPR